MSSLFKFVKKFFTYSVVSTTIVWSSMVSALLPTAASAAVCPTLSSGDMVKVVGKPAIYAVNNDMKILYFPSGDEFKSWTADNKYGGYISITQACFDSLAVPSTYPGAVNYRPGTWVVKRPSSDQLYVVVPGNSLAKITAEAASGLYGSGYRVMTVQDAFWPHYVNRGSDVTTNQPHVGMLVSNGGKTWYVDSGSVLREVTATGMTANRFQSTFVHSVTDAMVSGFTKGEAVTSEMKSWTDRVQMGGVVVAPPVPGTPAPVGGSLTVALAADNPAASYLASGTALNPVLKLVLSAGSDTNVTSVKVKKGGFLANTNISGIDVVDSKGVRHGNVVSSLSADNDVLLTFGTNPVMVKAGVPETLTVRANLCLYTGCTGSTVYSGTVQFSVASAASVTSNGTTGGTFPISGNTFNVQDGSNSVAGVVLNPQPVSGASGITLNADSVNAQDIAKFSFQETTSREAVKLNKLTLYNNGTAADGDVADVQLVEQSSSKVLATAQMVNKTVVFDLAAGGNAFLIDKGQIKYFLVRAKIVNGAARTIQFVVYNDYDAEVQGTTTNSLVLPTTNSAGNNSASSFPVGNASTYNKVTIGSGTISFNKDSSSPTSAVTPGQNNVVLGTYFAKAAGEDMELRKIKLQIVQTGPYALAGTLYIKVDGSVVYSASASGVNTTTLTSLTLSTYPILKANVKSLITVEANIDSNANSSASYKTYLQLTEVKRLITNDIVDPSVSAAYGNPMNVQNTALSVTNMTNPVAQNIVAGTNDFECARVELNGGGSGEDIKVNSVKFSDTIVSASASNLANFVLNTNGQPIQTSGNTISLTNNAVMFTFTTPILVTKTAPVVLSLRCDIVSGTSGSHKLAVTTTADVVAYGVSGKAATINTPNNSGQTMTLVSGGNLTVSLVSGSKGAPAIDQLSNIGTKDVSVFALKLTAQNEAQKLTTLRLTASGTAMGSNDVMNLRIYRNDETNYFLQGNQMGCGAAAGLAANTCQYFWTGTDNLLPDTIKPGEQVTLYVKADLGAAGSGVVGDDYKFYIASTTLDVITKGAFSGATSTPSGAPTAAGKTFITPWNVQVDGDTPAPGSYTNSINSGFQLARFKITNNGSGEITVTNVRLTDNGSHSTTALTYVLHYSSEGSADYLTNTASSTVADESNHVLDFSTGMTNFTISGGSYRYITVKLNAASGLATGDTFNFAVASLGDLKYSVTEDQLGYDNNNDGSISNATTVSGLYMNGKPILGTYVKSAN